MGYREAKCGRRKLANSTQPRGLREREMNLLAGQGREWERVQWTMLEYCWFFGMLVLRDILWDIGSLGCWDTFQRGVEWSPRKISNYITMTSHFKIIKS